MHLTLPLSPASHCVVPQHQGVAHPKHHCCRHASVSPRGKASWGSLQGGRAGQADVTGGMQADGTSAAGAAGRAGAGGLQEEPGC